MRRHKNTARLYRDLGNPTRLAIIARLEAGQAPREELERSVGVPAPSFSQHLQRLSRAGIILLVKSGRRSYYRLADPKILALNDAAEKIYRRSYEK
jgi:DNA-binding transcriptional ArsR family regulator